MVSKAELIVTIWFLVLSQFFRDGMGPFKTSRSRCSWLCTYIILIGRNFHRRCHKDEDSVKIHFADLSSTECGEYLLIFLYIEISYHQDNSNVFIIN